MPTRVEAGQILAASGVPTIEFRASIVIGDGSFSFGLIRKLVDWAPVIALPDWADNLAQPIALDDVLAYLEAAAVVDLEGSTVVEIGGADQISYRGLIEMYAEHVGSRRLTVTVPTPQVAVDAATALARPLLDVLPGEGGEALQLLESLRHSTVVRDPLPARAFDVQPVGVAAAIERAEATRS